jgi:predicted TIM-barrel fold metal-dependent hydrolase
MLSADLVTSKTRPSTTWPDVVDSHRHLWPSTDVLPSAFGSSLAEYFASAARELGDDVRWPAFRDELERLWVDPDGRRTIESMDDAGISRSILLAGGFRFDVDDPTDTFQATNQQLVELASRFRGRFAVFCGTHPGCRDASMTLASWLDADGAVAGVKLDPLAGRYEIDDDRMLPIYRVIADRGRPIVMHLGPRPEDPVSAFARPARLADVLTAFPDLVVVAAHAGFAWWRELVDMAALPNLLCDVSGFQLTAAVTPTTFAVILRRLIDAFGEQRVLFGTDSPTFDYFMRPSEWIAFLRGLPTREDLPVRFRDTEVEAILRSGRILLGEHNNNDHLDSTLEPREDAE